MKIEISKEEGDGIGALLKLVNNSRWLDVNKEPLVGKEAVAATSRLSIVLGLYNRILDAEKGGLVGGKMIDQETKPKRKRSKKKVAEEKKGSDERDK